MSNPHRCQALDPQARQCLSIKTAPIDYHGDSECYGTFHEPWPGWVRVYLCERHREVEKGKRR